MKSRTIAVCCGVFVIALGGLAAVSPARFTLHALLTGEPGSPTATTTIDGRYLPNPPATFGGTVNLSAKESKPWWPARVVPPKGAPNVLLTMTDDQGYGVSSTFGGEIPTPDLDRIAKVALPPKK